MKTISNLRDFTFTHYHFELLPLEKILLPSYKGSTLRGTFGYTLRKIICSAPGKDCSACLLSSSCIYPYIFEPTSSSLKEKIPKRFKDFSPTLCPSSSANF